MDQDETAVWVREAKAGSRASFGRLVGLYWATAVGLALGRIGDPVQAEDIAQESFLIAYRRLGGLKDDSRFAGWLSRIVYTQCITYLRRHRVRQTVPLAEATEDELASDPPGSSALTHEQRAKLLEVVGRLPAKYQEVLVLRFVTGLSAPKIARQLGQTPETIRTRLHRAYVQLRTELAGLADEVIQS